MNWKLLIEKLVANGLTQPQIAEHARCAQSTLSGIATGKTKDPRSSIGLALLKLALERGLDVRLPWGPAGAVVSEQAPPPPPAADVSPDLPDDRDPDNPTPCAFERRNADRGRAARGQGQAAGEGR